MTELIRPALINTYAYGDTLPDLNSLIRRICSRVNAPKTSDAIDEQRVVKVVEAVNAHTITSLQPGGLETCGELAYYSLRLSSSIE